MTTPHEDTSGAPGWGPVPGSGPQPPAAPPGQQPAPGYGQPPVPTYGQQPPVPAYGQQPPVPAYGQPPVPTYGQQPPVPAYGQQPAPGYPPAPPAYGQVPPGYPQAPPAYGQPGYGQQPVGYSNAPYGAQPWRPPAFQPGIVPLRPLGVWEILDGAFRAIRANPRVMFGLTAIVVAVVVALQAVAQWYVGGLLAGSVDDLLSSADTSGDMPTGMGDQLGTSFASLFTTPFVALATTLLTGLLIVSVSRSVIGQKVSLADVRRIARGRIWWVLGFTMLVGAATLAVGGLLIGGIVLLARAESWGALAALAILGGLGFAVLAVWVTVRTLLVPAALMLEGTGFWTSVRRAWRLTRGSFWRLFGTYLLVQIIVGIVGAVIVYPATIISMLVFQDQALTSFGGIMLSSVGSAIALTLTTVYSAAVIALMYIDVRMRREGLDVELARAATAKDA